MKNYLQFILLLLLPAAGFANNIQVSNVTIASQDLQQNLYHIEFDLSWENSWRTSTHESNWDAAWVFIKYTKKNQQDWHHTNLAYVDGSNDGHIAPPGCTIVTEKNTYGNTTYGVGVMVYRDSDGIGDINFEGIQLVWNYGDNAIDDDDDIEISVHAIEMVYVPQGSFSVGDTKGDFGQFEAGTTGDPFLIDSEAILALGGNQPDHLCNNNTLNQLNDDDFNYVSVRTLLASFPKGYNAFYCMKYETSQAQYASFLSQLTNNQKEPHDGPHYANAVNVFPIIDGNYWATADFPARPIFYISWDNMAAYLDWAALRPMTELEFEKACRGPEAPIENELAWGNNSWYISGLYDIQDEGTEDEIIVANMGEKVGNANTVSQFSGSPNPIRCGIFAASAKNKTRQETGASYWGIMEMSGNCYELIVSVGSPEGRSFTGRHGNGHVSNIGEATYGVMNWPEADAIGIGYRSSEVSTRYGANYNIDTREKWHGIRGVRTASQ